MYEYNSKKQIVLSGIAGTFVYPKLMFKTAGMA